MQLGLESLDPAKLNLLNLPMESHENMPMELHYSRHLWFDGMLGVAPVGYFHQTSQSRAIMASNIARH